MSASSALQKAIVAALKADPDLVNLVGGRISDEPPAKGQKPFVSLGPSSHFPERQDGFKRRIEVVQIDVWDASKKRRQPCKAICDAVEAALDQANLILDDPYGLGRCDLILSQVADDPDGITKHGILQFQCEITG